MVKLTEGMWVIQRLIQVGFLIPLDSVDIYSIKNNQTENSAEDNNSNLLNIMLATNYKTAKFIADSEYDKNYPAEVEKMVSLGGKYYFINTDISLSDNLSETNNNITETIKNGVKYLEEMRSSGLNQSFPIELGSEEVYDQVYGEFAKLITNNHPFIMQQDIESVFSNIIEANKNNRKFLIRPEKFVATVQTIVTQFAGSLNARTWLLDNPAMAIYGYTQKMLDSLEGENSNLSFDQFKFTKQNVSADMFSLLNATYKDKNIPINWQYFSTWLKKNNIVGSVTKNNLNNEQVPVYALFDLETVKTESEQNEIYCQIINKYGELISVLSNVSSSGKLEQFLLNASPEECVKFINNSKTQPNLANLSSGTWENYSIGEHTEAVLRVYENNFAKTMPSELQPFMKLAITLHDIGKGVAVSKKRNGEYANEHEETYRVCQSLFKELQLNKQTSELLSFVMLDSQKYTTDFYVYRSPEAEQQLLSAIKDKFIKVYNVNPSDKQVNGIASMCKILQTCDSYSYTPNSVIRKVGEHGDVYIHGANNNFSRNSVTGKNSVEYLRPDASNHASDPYSGIKTKK